MYNFITSPVSSKVYPINSKMGKKIIKNFLNLLLTNQNATGGSKKVSYTDPEISTNTIPNILLPETNEEHSYDISEYNKDMKKARESEFTREGLVSIVSVKPDRQVDCSKGVKNERLCNKPRPYEDEKNQEPDYGTKTWEYPCFLNEDDIQKCYDEEGDYWVSANQYPKIGQEPVRDEENIVESDAVNESSEVENLVGSDVDDTESSDEKTVSFIYDSTDEEDGFEWDRD